MFGHCPQANEANARMQTKLGKDTILGEGGGAGEEARRAQDVGARNGQVTAILHEHPGYNPNGQTTRLSLSRRRIGLVKDRMEDE